MKRSRADRKVHAALAEVFERNGVLRLPDPDRRADEGQAYKKGYEVRLVVFSREELRHVRRLLRQAGFPRRTPFAKGLRWVQPIYGKEHVERFQELVAAVSADARKNKRNRRKAVRPS
ncbi:MAG: hypothetical protein ACREJB_10190 [Planctomycetaceae bacterium]